MPSPADVLKELPPALKRRFDSLGGFVNAVIREIEERREIPRKRRLTADVRQDIALLVFIASLRHFLREGARAASAAADKAIDLGFSGFTVGAHLFSPGNENTRRGAVLADALWACVEDRRLKNLLDSERSLSKLTEELYAIARNPERLDRHRETPQ